MVRSFFRLVRLAALTGTAGALMYRSGCLLGDSSCFDPNFFSYFTIHSNLMLVLVQLPAMWWAGRREPQWLTALRALATTYVLVSGVVFGVLLANAQLLNHIFLVPMSSRLLHFAVPVYAVLDFVLGPARHRLHWKVGWLAMIFPLAWVVYTVIRGRLSGWYPYFFLDPNAVGGYGVVSVYAGVLGVFILLVSFLMVAASRLPSLPVR